MIDAMIEAMTMARGAPQTAQLPPDLAARANQLALQQQLAARRRHADAAAPPSAGFDVGWRAVHPLTGESLPVFVADYVLRWRTGH